MLKCPESSQKEFIFSFCQEDGDVMFIFVDGGLFYYWHLLALSNEKREKK